MLKLQAFLLAAVCLFLGGTPQSAESDDVNELVAAMLGETPIVDDLRELTDEIGGRPTGSKSNLAAVDWALEKFGSAGVTAYKESFTVPALWLGQGCKARVTGDVSFDVRASSMPFSVGTAPEGIEAPLLDVARGTPEDFARIKNSLKGAFAMVEVPALMDIGGLFREYNEKAAIERRAIGAGAIGVVYMSSRPDGVLFRHNSALGFDNELPILAIERSQARRIMRLLRAGRELRLWTRIDIEEGGSYESYNVIGEVEGNEKPDEYVVIGAHLDSWGLGQGANDNGCNVAMMIDIARQMKKLGIKPRRSIRFVLWNGEEQGLIGSWRYTSDHTDELDRHVIAGSIDIGSGRITGFFTNGRPELLPVVERALEPVHGLGPFEQIDVPVVGTDNYDFMVHGIANFVANHNSYNYGPTYHASNDTFDKVDIAQLKKNAAVVAAVVSAFAEMDVTWKRQTRAEIQALIDNTDLGSEMETFNLMDGWNDGSRGRQ